MDATSTLSANQAGLAPLAAHEIEQALAVAGAGNCCVEAVAITDSTNNDLVARVRAQQPSQCVLRAADFQTGGRGRHQRAWRASGGDALLFSIAIPMTTILPSPAAVTLACGVAIAECLSDHGVTVQLKWPNDIRADGHKLAGILSELVIDRAAKHTLVIGIGMNVRLDEAVRRAIEQPAIALDQLLLPQIDRRRELWIGCLGGAIIAAVAQFVRDGFDPFCARFNRLLEARGNIVDVVDGNRGAVSGRVIEVDRFGRLLIESGSVIHRISVGDVSVRQ